MTILRNRAQCKLCGDIVESVHVHDFRRCKCGAMAVDGGKSYLKRCARGTDAVLELSEVTESGVDA